MTTSGTVGLTQLDAITVIEHAARRCGVLATVLTAEMLTSARENLFLILSAFITQGLQLWCQQKTVYPLSAGLRFLYLNLGSVDLENVLLRSATMNAATNLSVGTATYSPATAIIVGSVTLDVPAGAYSFVLEGSADGVTWVQYGAYTVTPTARTVLSFDSDVVATLAFWRVRETLTGLVNFNSVTFNTNATEINMSLLNKDDYALMPNKEFMSTKPLQFWFDKQLPRPRLWFWPLPQDATTMCVVWSQQQIQDVGDLTNTIQVPQQWLDAVISELATRVCLELPKELVPPDRYDKLTERAEKSLSDARDAEVDGSPLRLVPRIGGYTK